MEQLNRRRHQLIALGVFLVPFGLYVGTLAPSVVPGDPGEYQFIPHILGIAHPPGYAFFTLLARAWTSLIRVGSIAYRSNLLAAAAGAWTGLMAYGMVRQLAVPPASPANENTTGTGLRGLIAALFAAAALVTATDVWQHSIHANAHIVSAALAATTLFAGLRWWRGGRDRWLYGFALLAALGVTHHPLLAFGAPAYVAFVLAVRPRLLLDVRRLAGVLGSILVGLSVFAYLPLRAGATPFGPSPTADAIIGHALARGIRVNLFHYGLADQPVRLRVFWELLRLQYAPLTLLLAAVGLGWLAWRRPRPFVLLGLFLGVQLAFTINSVQDVMAYLLLPFTAIAVLAGAGLLAVWEVLSGRISRPPARAAALGGGAVLLAAGPLLAAVHLAPRLTLRDYRWADRYIQAVFDQFAGKGEGAVLLAPWEGMTPLHYAEQVEGRRLDPADVKPVFVASGTANPWVEFVWKHIEDGPIYLIDYRPQVAAEGFRLYPVGDWPFYRVEAPPAASIPAAVQSLDLWAGDAIHLIGWQLDRPSLRAGETAYLTLHMQAERELADYYMPYARVGERWYRWTTDSRLNTPWWLPGETVVERYPLTVPFGTPAGDYPIKLGVSNLSQGQDLLLGDGGPLAALPVALHVEPAELSPASAVLAAPLANLDSRIVLRGATASARGTGRSAPWSSPLPVHPGDRIQVWLDWQALTAVDQSYSVFVHLIDGAGRLWAQHDYTPLGGAFPTFLWIPRWIEGQRVKDPYQLTVPADAPPGTYLLETGMYGMTSLQRVQHFDPQGNLAGDRTILGPVQVIAP
jgi:hypothetical protein